MASPRVIPNGYIPGPSAQGTVAPGQVDRLREHLKVLEQIQQKERQGWENAVGAWLLDRFSGDGGRLDHDLQKAQADFKAATAGGGLTAAAAQKVEVDLAHAETDASAYHQLKDRAGGIAGMVAGTAGAVLLTVATDGAAAPVAAKVAVAGLGAAVGTVGAKQVIEGKDYTTHQMVVDGAVNLIGGAAGGAAAALGAGGRVAAAVGLSKGLGAAIVDGSVNGAAVGGAMGAASAGLDGQTWRHGALAGIADVSVSTGMGIATGAAFGGVMGGAAHALAARNLGWTESPVAGAPAGLQRPFNPDYVQFIGNFLREYPQAESLRMDPVAFQRAFGRGPYDGTLAELAQVKGFAALARSRPDEAFDLYSAARNGRPAAAEIAQMSIPQALKQIVRQRRIAVPGSDSQYWLLESRMPGEPALKLAPGEQMDWNGVFHSKAPAVALRRYQATDVPQQGLPTYREQIYTAKDVQATDADLQRMVVWEGHGDLSGFEGVGTKVAAQMTAEQILSAEAAGRPRFLYVLLDSCSQDDLRIPFHGQTNAARFERAINAELAAQGHPPVTVLAAERPGALWVDNVGNGKVLTQRNLLGLRFKTRFVPVALQRPGLGPDRIHVAVGNPTNLMLASLGGLLLFHALQSNPS